MRSNNETVSRQMPWAGNIHENYDFKRETVHCYPRNVDRCCAWSLESQQGFQIFVLFCYITNHLMTGPLGNSEFCFPRRSFISGNIEILGKQNSLFPSGPVIKCLILTGAISFWKLGVVHGPGPWSWSMDQVHGVVHGGPWTGSMGWSMDHGPCFVYVQKTDLLAKIGLWKGKIWCFSPTAYS